MSKEPKAPLRGACTNCGRRITKYPNGWQHDVPEEGLKPGYCRPVQIARPRRGSTSRDWRSK